MSQPKLTKEDFDGILSVVGKKLRNKKKKMDKIVATEIKIVNKELDPSLEQQEMVASKDKVESQIKELEEMKKMIKSECNRVFDKHNEIVNSSKSNELKKVDVVTEALENIADACLINLLEKHYDVNNLVNEEESVGLESLLLPLKSLLNPSQNLMYSRAREVFVNVFTSFLTESRDIVPGSEVHYKDLLAE